MTSTAAAPQGMVEGQQICHTVGTVEVVLLCVRPGYAYRVRVLNGGFEIAELSRSYATEVQARSAARGAVKLFNRGASVQLVLDSFEYAQTVLSVVNTPAPVEVAAAETCACGQPIAPNPLPEALRTPGKRQCQTCDLFDRL